MSPSVPAEKWCLTDVYKEGRGQEQGNLLPNFFSYKLRNVLSKMVCNCLRCQLGNGFKKDDTYT